MPAMETEPGTLSPSAIVISWLAASAAFPLALIGAVLGQGLGALVGGCQWIGITLPLGRQVWALVNQPVLNFAALPSAGGYWLGSTFLPLVMALTITSFLPRARSFVVELVVVQIAWAMSVVAVAWMPLLDGKDGHLARFLALHGSPTVLVWLAPALAAVAALLPTLRLLELARRRRTDIRRGGRQLVVIVHLALPTAAWVGAAFIASGSFPLLACLAAAMPVATVLVFAWFRFPAPYVHRLELPKASELAGLAAAAALLWCIVWFAGRPLPEGRSVGVLWAHAQSFNNIRPWIEPQFLTGEKTEESSH
jgi:hypothetical protein